MTNRELSALSSSRLFSLEDFQRKLGIQFKNESLLDTALTHKSFVSRSHSSHNERLEFLGDSVLGLAIAHILYRQNPEFREGELARIKSVLVSEHVLADVAEKINLADYLLLGKGEEANGGRKKIAILADAFEAFLGALFLDQGLETVEKLVQELIVAIKDKFISGSGKDYKTMIQEFTQKRGLPLPLYTLAYTEGPDHAQRFFVYCKIADEQFGPWAGKNRKEAEQNAAKEVFAILYARSESNARLLDSIAGKSVVL